MSFTGIAFEMAAIDDGMFKAVEKATSFVSGMNDVLQEQVGRIRNIKKEDFYGAMEKGVKVASKSINHLARRFDVMLGVEKTVVKSTVDGFGDISKSVKHLDRGIGEMANKMKSKLGEAFAKGKKDGESFFESLKKRADRFNLADIASNMKALTGDTGNLSNDLERQMASMVQTTRPIIANLNLSSNEIKKMAGKAAGIAYGMNTDAGSVAETMKSIMTANKGAKATLDAMGMSTKDWVKVVQTANVKMDDMTTIMGDLTTSWNMAPKQAAGLIDSMVAVGKVAGVGTLPLQNVKELLGEMRTIFGKLPPGMQRTAGDMEKLIESTVRGAGVFKDFGASESEAVTKSNAVAKMFASQAVAMNQAFDIGGKEAASDTPLFKYLIQLGLGYDGARDIIETGSRDVVAGMGKLNKVYATFGESQLYQTKQVLGGLNESLGEGASGLEFLAMSTGKGSDAIAKFSNMSVKGDGALKKFGNDAYSSGLTLQDSFDRAKLAFDTTIRSISRENVVGLVKKQMAGIKEAGQEIKAMGSDKTWGPWVHAISQFKQMGIGGVFASMAESSGVGAKNAAKFGAKVGLVFDTVKDLGSELAPVMQMIGMTGPLGPLLAAGGIGALLMMDESSAREVLGPMYDSFADLKNKAGELWDKFYPKFVKIWDEQIKPKVKKFWSEDVVGFLKEAAPVIGGAFLDMLKWAWSQIGEVFGTSGQAATGFGVAVVAGMATPLLGLAASAGGAMMGVLNGPAGLVVAAGAAGVLLGNEIRKAFVDPKMEEFEKSRKAFEVADSFKNTDLSKYSDSALTQNIKQLEQGIKVEKAALASLNAQTMSMGGTAMSSSTKIDELMFSKKRMVDALAVRKTEGNVSKYSGGESSIGDEWDIMSDASSNAGYQTIQNFGAGFASGLEETVTKVKETQDGIADYIGRSLPVAGPLAEGVGAYGGGYETMMSFAQGISDSSEMVKLAVEQVMEDSVLTSIEVYATKMQQLAEQKTLLESVAKSIVNSMGGKIDTTIDTEADVNVKKSFQTALNVPGLAGVILAIVDEGGKTRKMLKKIHEESVVQTSLMRGGKVVGSTGSSVYVPAP